ncbi:MAG: GNAT family N-acetyltransferase [Candidatus Thermoplasmatota archaeon]|nr:GNAT family N-acetyltransferase [Candidatus Thermoplasmatota archaeon]MCL5253046.1 GNAT family N-acetyltransferase [Candidatus Thermoplasmatota archaeon]
MFRVVVRQKSGKQVFTMDISFRRMGSEDIPFVLSVTAEEQWYLTEKDISFYTGNKSALGTVAEIEGIPVGAATAVIYGRSAWIGNVIVKPEMRNIGLGRRLVDSHMLALRENGVEEFMLYAYDRSKSLYERMNFVFDAVFWELALQPDATGRRSISKNVAFGYSDEIGIFDGRYFRNSRSEVLRFASSRPGSGAMTHRNRNGEIDGYLLFSRVDDSYGTELAPFICTADALADMMSSIGIEDGIFHVYVPQQNLRLIDDLRLRYSMVRRIHRGHVGEGKFLPIISRDVISPGFLEMG